MFPKFSYNFLNIPEFVLTICDNLKEHPKKEKASKEIHIEDWYNIHILLFCGTVFTYLSSYILYTLFLIFLRFFVFSNWLNCKYNALRFIHKNNINILRKIMHKTYLSFTSTFWKMREKRRCHSFHGRHAT